jgi:two-component system CheB/CheR fusion protein
MKAKSKTARLTDTTTPSAARRLTPSRRLSASTRIVGLGCSAGGLEACEQFLTHLAPDTGLAFVLVSHLDPARKGIMPELLQRCTPMAVCQAEDGMSARPNRVYVIPPNVDLSILHGKFQLLEPSAPRGLRLPIDFFFKHLAQDQKEHSVGIILSGMGTDGTQGLKAIKQEMGLVLAQDPASARYDGMPRSAIATGLVDMIAPAAELPARLAGFVKHAAALSPQAAASETKPSSALEKVFVLLRARTGTDFSVYKATTIHRRLERRLSVHRLETMAHYVRYLQENPQELDLLFRELLIGVTNFFRDPAAFQVLKEKAIPQLLEGKAPGSPLRVWVPGCATGEEAYSLMVALMECLEQCQGRDTWPIQMFATDLHKEAIDQARQGVFPANIAAEVSPERLRRFFVQGEHGYTIKKALRERIVFAPHNVLTDPPFTKLDLLCCRNLLIYLKADCQKRLLTLFHYALNPGGLLFLGSAETIGGLANLYAPVDHRWKIFTSNATPSGLKAVADLPGPRVLPAAEAAPAAAQSLPVRRTEVAEAAQRLLLETFLPPAVVINPEGDIIYVVGRTGKYLEAPTGKANLNVFAMARQGLRQELGLAIRDAVRRKASVTAKRLHLKTDGAEALVNLTVRPLDGGSSRDLLLVIFEEVEPEAAGGKKPVPRLHSRGVAREIEKELQQTRAALQSTFEERQAAEEELKAANEELQSNNEEMQSTNEELTTSKEELQSLNEEMSTVNAELQNKLDQLSEVNDDMRNLLNGIDVATVFADNDLRIKRFTQQATGIINLIPTDLGRPLSHLATNLKYERLMDDAKEVLRTLVFQETQVQTNDGRWHLMRILPYRTADNVIDGVVITFTEVTQLKRLEASLQEAQLFAESIIATVREPLVVLDGDLRIVSANRSFYATFGLMPEQTERRLLYEVADRQWDIPALRRLLQEILPKQTELQDFKVEHDFSGVGRKVLLLNARQVYRPDQRPPLILLAMEPATPPP